MKRLAFAIALLVGSGVCRADDVTLRGNYWRDRNTRVLAPEIEFNKELPSGTSVSGGYLLDAITSASLAAGVLADQPFTELRNQVGGAVAQRIGPATVGGNYRYSTESDYQAHTGGGSAAVDLFQKNTTLAVSYTYSHAEVSRRTGPTAFIQVGHLNSQFVIASFTQVLSRFALGDLSYEYSRIGDASDPQSFQSNPYRTVKVAGTPQIEIEPRQRQRHAITAGVRIAVPLSLGVVHNLSLYAKYRFYVDDWGVQAHSPELRTYATVGPVEIRVTGRYYTQTGADFFRAGPDGAADYANGPVSFLAPTDPNHCSCFTGDAKLSPFESYFLEARLGLALSFLDSPKIPLGRWLGGGVLAVSYGHYFNTRFAHIQYGDAEVGGVELALPL